MRVNGVQSVAVRSVSANSNFKGLWGNQNKIVEQRDRSDIQEGCEFIERKTLTTSEYYPFADETEAQINKIKEDSFSKTQKNEIQFAEHNTVWAYVLDTYNEHQAKIMPKLSFTAKQFGEYAKAQLDKVSLQKVEGELKKLNLTKYIR